MIKKSFYSNHAIPLFILVLGSVLRFYKLGEIPFTHDEFSALLRTQHTSFSNLIEFGVKGDGHPAGLQVLLYYLVKWFGFNNFLVKLPFVILGILSIFLVYKIAKTWFNETTALLSATFLATLQFPIMYSQIARPYISGVFFCLLLVFFWDKYIFRSIKKVSLYLLGFTISAILCSYNHYFSLLFVAIIGIIGVLFIDKKRILFYLLSGLVIFMAFIPHLKITLDAISIGGLEWLGKPKASFLLDFFKMAFHSYYLIIFIFISIGILSFRFPDATAHNKKFTFISILLFITSYLAGHIYSVVSKPVLQFSVLIFSFPFLLIFLFSFIKELSFKFNLILVIVFSSAISISLIFEKKHYTHFYISGFSEILKENNTQINIYSDNLTSLILSSTTITKYYLEHNPCLYPPELRKLILNELKNTKSNQFAIGITDQQIFGLLSENNTISDLEAFISELKSDYLYLGWAHNFPNKLFEVIPIYYPYLIEQKGFFNSETYLFSRNKGDSVRAYKPYFNSINNFSDKSTKYWSSSENLSPTNYCSESISEYIDKNTEFSSVFSSDFKDIIKNPSDHIFISVNIYTTRPDISALLVCSVEKNNKPIQWNASPLLNFCNSENTWQKVNLNVQLHDVRFLWNKKIKIYIWNPNNDEFYIDDFSVNVYSGNKNRYSY